MKKDLKTLSFSLIVAACFLVSLASTINAFMLNKEVDSLKQELGITEDGKRDNSTVELRKTTDGNTTKIKEIENKIDEQNKKLEDMNKTVENVNSHFGAIEASVNDVTKYGSAISDLESRVIVTEAYIKKSKDNLSHLSSSSNSTTNAQKYIYCMQQYVNGVSSSSTCN